MFPISRAATEVLVSSRVSNMWRSENSLSTPRLHNSMNRETELIVRLDRAINYVVPSEHSI